MRLVVDRVSRAFGGVYAVRDVSLTVEPGELRAVIGPNGAGKSTLFALIGGQLAANAGRIEVDGRPVRRLPAHRRARLGIGVVFQAARIFTGMTAAENVMVGAHATTRAGFLAGALRLPAHHRDEREIRSRALACLDRTGLADWADRPAEELPLGQQRALQLARALCARPRLLLLDEPASGLRAGERESLAALIGDLRAEGLTMLLVEHDVGFVMRLADQVTVLDLGRVIASGPPAAIRTDPAVIAAYLGTAPAGRPEGSHP
ncbi:branched-chain amino acid transport system ATP-binding protein [Actinoplanes lutulentus]|uniref:Amino acid/amide ABC transporter ATP-binding protein 1 (HAAT family) n=1 Tax=Actinoplanes lutulentus TaxID=1287878 RepID=A0A327ZK78_9ACTN|nr:ABC transporter ATP-binding protein [Actinoplanes lutulentus]MBB2944362.1 branched-chain amino acid transport system ATP-binding protein [Actinoplanes lutulentus]RAK42406.1 amino acid/amide ABC transporter ATP-binding protein 1 (HAAT family) [Actinoplanes lutulentus]